MAEAKKSNKGLIIGIVLALGFALLVCGGGGIWAGYKYYWQPREEARKALEALGSMTPVPPTDMTPTSDSYMPAETETATPDATQMAEATMEPTVEPSTPEPATSAPDAATKVPAAKKTKAPKTAAPATEAPTEEPTEAPKPKPRKAEFEISHVHGGLSKKSCTGMIELLDTGFKYEATSSEDDRKDSLSYSFGQIKKVEKKDYKTLEISTTDKKWTFKGDGLTLAKVYTHLDSHKNEFAGK
jgi:cytoskeletal protein RodZ